MPNPAKPIGLQLLHGNKNHRTKDEIEKRLKNEERLKIGHDNIKPPSWLDKTAQKEFKRLAKLLIEVELMTDADITHLALYCDAYSQYLSFKAQVKKHGMWIEDKPNPFIKKMSDMVSQLRSLSSDLGLNPSARAKLAINFKEPNEDDEDEF
ncbi:P27 family predicted phage terminase small subunit [Clostridium acetobutylicum]|uniref:Phage terminase-like protein, small subunit n=1 Tax=Clostridium acetobutylicum (strain ATCC 824 / DSM 792 / JCM 1419 / IAM 19013 / LMG 5710 / NBRC 13948 / NRRL B-527 / VKM B-1787 / 2291 / W) TaxID=272562 RepID=Q97HW1_CLOAB|nr:MULTISPECIES: phage terminase small subunit P27 family [Clostridium]AAK79859.1 Phage terminase-like protein, small subunit [Clostridium acetobutylicum ATCC 824]ADZ20945.1 Phage terminase-like protein, small subunit [Clostridium acetobutylicum EA 2018]AEI32034.1 Phage terminase-like protein, small subunit [Clostridium acetobutylicum DSM 1731]AWV79712.1 phage terminase small subunit P27 family [Clostridium acetobutylicum]MBC2394311.1 phage terminase small subunit P27 family [Clostridium aceto